MRIADRVFLITGASSGLGSAVSEMIIGAGGNAMLVDLNDDLGTQRVAELGTAARFTRADVTRSEDAQGAVSKTLEVFGRIDGLVNCAGVAPGEKIVGRDGPHDLESFARTVSINLIGTFNMLRLTAAAIVEQSPDDGGERGVIVNTSSIAAFDGQIGQAAYAASKGGVASLTLPAARELARFGIRVVAIAPGIFATPMMSGMPQDVQDKLGAAVPFPSRLGRPDEFAALVGHIIENTMLNGEVVRLDGALRMAPR